MKLLDPEENHCNRPESAVAPASVPLVTRSGRMRGRPRPGRWTAADCVTDGQVSVLVDWIKRHVLPVWSALPMVFPTHVEVESIGETGQRDGKSDVCPVWEGRADELRRRIMAARTGDVPASVPDRAPARFSVGQGILEAMAARGDQPAADELLFKAGERDAWSEAYGTSGARYVWLPATARVHRYDPSA